MSYNGFKSIFFEDQNVFKNDLNNIEYSKIRLFRDTLAALIEQPGVAIPSLVYDNLKVSGSVVNSGIAIDKYGRIIYVPDSIVTSGSIYTDPYYHPAWPSKTASGSGDYINIYYSVQYDISETDDSGTSHYTRAYDSYRILREGSAPSDESGGICLSHLGADQRPLLLLRSQLVAIPIVDEAWNKDRQATTVLNNNVQNIYWFDDAVLFKKKAEIAYKHSATDTLMTIRFYVWNSDAGGVLKVEIYNSLTESVVLTNSRSFPAGNGFYDLLLPISSLSDVSLYFIKISVMTFVGPMYTGGVIIYVT
jgi:hypothetical protein